MKFRKVARHALLTLLVLLALIGIPVVPPKKIEMDKDDEIKTEISDESRKD
jgi:hypothetical protein